MITGFVMLSYATIGITLCSMVALVNLLHCNAFCNMHFSVFANSELWDVVVTNNATNIQSDLR